MTSLTSVLRASTTALLVLAFLGATAMQAAACGADTDCPVGARSYRIVLPQEHASGGWLGAIIFVHGYRGSAAGVMGNRNLTALASELGVALIAAQAAGPEWSLPNVPSVDASPGIDELAYFDALRDDVVKRFPIDGSRILVAGFSSGAMMVWHLACHRGRSFAGFVPISGTFWAPIPESCPTLPANLIHYHGKDDPIVPLRGRQIKDAHQGDVFQAIELVARLGSYRPVNDENTRELECSRQADDTGRVLELCLFPGKHELKARHLARAARIVGISATPR